MNLKDAFKSLARIYIEMVNMEKNNNNVDSKTFISDNEINDDELETYDFFGNYFNWKQEFPLFVNTKTKEYMNCFAVDLLYDCIGKLEDGFILNEDSGDFAEKCDNLARHYNFEDRPEVVTKCVSMFDEKKSLIILTHKPDEDDNQSQV